MRYHAMKLNERRRERTILYAYVRGTYVFSKDTSRHRKCFYPICFFFKTWTIFTPLVVAVREEKKYQHAYIHTVR
jgi:hypothetical protein